MRWQGRARSQNVEDRRGFPARGAAVGGGLGTIVIVLLVALFGGDLGALLPNAQGPGGPPGNAAEEEPLKEFVEVVLKDTEDVWNRLLPEERRVQYREPTLILFSGQVESGCGFASAQVGPFYCPQDQNVYLDLSFFQELRTRFGAPGDFAMAYVVAHEVGHHVQNLLGLSDRVHQERGRVSKEEYNRLSVRLELQADFLAGVWAHHAEANKQILEEGDINEALTAATAIGDDRLQQQSQGYVVPDAFTHGTSAQRVRWFRRGFETGDLSQMEELFRLPYEQL